MSKWINILFLLAASIAYPHTIYVKDLEADFSKFDSQNYATLKSAYVKASNEDCAISYEGIDTIKLDIPKNAKSIRLPNVSDFEDVVFIVKNNQKDFTLFEYSNKLNSIEIDRESFCKSNYSSIREFSGRDILLVAKDKNPWVKERFGYGYPHIRRDIILINHGKSQNEPIQPYGNIYSNPELSYCDITNDSVRVRNLNFIRTENSTYKTFCLKIQNSNNIVISNLYLKTPQSDLYGDAMLSFINCTNIRVSDVLIDGTYSQKNKYGYGISMNNVYDCHFKNLYGDGNWGVFGNNNVNTVYIDDSNLNRFDIHCYGKDVFCSNTAFHTLYNQFSSFYGTLKYDKCSFENFVPLVNGGSYSAYTQFNVEFNECYWKVDPKRPFLANMSQSKFLIDTIRPELNKLEYPNIFINGMNIECPKDLSTLYFFHTYKKQTINLDNNPIIDIRNLSIDSDIAKFELSNSILE